MSMEDKILEAILLEADRLKIDASPEHMNQSKKEIRRTQDYTVNEDEEDNDEEVESDDSNQNNEDEDGNTDYTANVPGNEDQGGQEDTGDDNAEDNQEEEPAEDEGTENDAGDEEPQEDTGEDDTGADDNADEGGDEAGEGDEGGTDYTDMDAGDVEGGDDEGGDDTGDDAGDDSASDDTSTDDSGDGSTPETDEQVNERHLKVKQLSLMNQMTGLHTSINTYLTQINDIERTNIYVSSIISTVIDNFNKLKDVIYKYIIYYFDNMSYEYNLYTFNYFIEAMKVNIELLAKIKDANNYEAE